MQHDVRTHHYSKSSMFQVVRVISGSKCLRDFSEVRVSGRSSVFSLAFRGFIEIRKST